MGVDRPIDITTDQRKTLLALLKRYLPNTTAWVYGSRVKWTSRPQSDLDMVVFTKLDQERRVSELREAFEESNLPFRVDLFVWDAVPEPFRKEIEAEHVVLVERQGQIVGVNWQVSLLGELVNNFDARRIPLSKRERENRHGAYPYYGATGVMDHINDFLFEGLHLLVAEDGSVERPDGTPFLQLANGKFWVNNHAHVLKGATDNETKFLYYALSNVLISPYIGGSVQAKLSQANLNKIPIVHPTNKADRRAIVSVLGTLDDKIELNRRMNETLEAMARILFKSWFIDFDPVRAKMAGRDPGLPQHLADLFPDRLVDSELGPIPERWEVKALGDGIEIYDSVRIPLNSRQRTERQGSYPYYGATGIMDYVDDFLFEGIYVLTGEDGSVVDANGYPVVQYVWGQFWVNNHAHVLKGKNGISEEHLYLLLQQENIEPFVTGAVQPKLSQKNLMAIPIVFPDVLICQAFSDLIRPIFAALRSNADESITLTALRNVLLPKLISGSVRLNKAEFAFGGIE